MLAVLPFLLLSASLSPALRLEIASPKTRLSAFEPVKLTVRATALRPAAVPSMVDPTGFPLFETWIDYGEGFRQYVDYDGDMREGVEGTRRPLAPGGSFVETLVLVNGPMDQATVPFPSPGRYPLRVVARMTDGTVLGDSNTLTFDVAAPEAEGQLLVQRIRHQPWVMRARGGSGDAEYASLAADFPHSPYLHWGRHEIALEKQHRIANGRYPDTDGIFDEAAQGVPLAKTLFQQLATELLSTDTWGQFDEERLLLAAENLERGGAYDEALAVWREIAERFPGSEAAERARNRVDTTPPTLQVSASPSTLWPPNNKLVTVTVAVNVTDDTDPGPSVKLLSVTCDDTCNPPQDIVGATLNTDDRSFQLRATRQGGGTGRTYAITFSATDDAGNRATAQTTVRVPHDQGQ